MSKLHLDFESASLLDLEEVGLDRYVRHESTRVLMLAWALGDDEVQLWQPHLEPEMPAKLRKLLAKGTLVKSAWNAAFERNILLHVLKMDIPIDQWEDPASWARNLSLPGNLEDAGDVLGIGDKAKISDGKRLIRKFCEPASLGGEVTLFGVEPPYFRDWNSDPQDWKLFCEYCKQDVVAEREMMRLMAPSPLPEAEQFVWQLDLKINERGIPTNRLFAERTLMLAQTKTDILKKSLKEKTGLENPNSTAQILKWLKEQGYEYDSVGKTRVASAIGDTGSPLTDLAREVLVIRQQTSKSGYKKLVKLATQISDDDHLRHQFVFMGASRTARWCLAEGSMVRVRDENRVIADKPIETVNLTDEVWDGERWVKHDGVVFSGERDTIKWDNVDATPEHEVWVSETEKVTLRAAKEQHRNLWCGVSTYEIYKLTSPSGRFYIGLTKMGLRNRWRKHVKFAQKNTNHPLYNAIRKYGAESFKTEVIDRAPDKESAQELEKFHIAQSEKFLLYNISSGGEADGEDGARIFWDRLKDNPVARNAYLKKLSDVKKKNDWTNYPAMTQKNLEWRHENPREAYKMSARNLRVFNRENAAAPKPERSLKHRLSEKHRPGLNRRDWALQTWANRTESEKKAVSDKISVSTKNHLASKTADELRQITAKARASTDRKKQGAAAGAGLKNYWVELKKNPEELARQMARRAETRLANLRHT